LLLIAAFIMITMTIIGDVKKKEATSHEEAKINIQKCAQEYRDNRCRPEERVPAMEDFCLEREKCMALNPAQVVTSSRMTASILAEVANAFVDPLSYKTIGFVFLLIFGFIFCWNCSLRGGSHTKVIEPPMMYHTTHPVPSPIKAGKLD
jgi:hypothetical protein